MSAEERHTLTGLLGQLGGGRDDAFAELTELVYEDLHRVAGNRLRRQFGDRMEAMTITPTALANDALMALRDQRAELENSGHFFAIATRLMFRLITDYQRHRLADKRGGGDRGGPLVPEDAVASLHTLGAIDADGASVASAMARFHEAYPRKAEVVTLHVVAGHPLPKVAELIGVSTPTVERDWRFAKAWLASALEGEGLD